MNLKFLRSKGKVNLTELANKFDSWAKEFEKAASAKGLAPSVYHTYIGKMQAFRDSAQEIRQLMKVN